MLEITNLHATVADRPILNGVTLDVPAGEAFHHVRWRQYHQPHVFVRIDPASRHPEAQLIIVV